MVANAIINILFPPSPATPVPAIPAAPANTDDTSDEPLERRMYQLTDLTGNHNKFYMVELWPAPDGKVRFRASWGRVGSKPQSSEKVMTPYAVEAQIAEKVRKGYRRIELHRPEVEIIAQPDDPPLPKLDPKVVQLVDWIFLEAGEHIRSYLAVEVDALGQDQINEGRRLLSEAQTQYNTLRLNPFKRDQNMKVLAGTVQGYYNAIPTKLPARMDPESVVLDFCKQLNEQEDRLLQLEAAIAMMKVERKHPGQSHYQNLGADINVLPADDPARMDIVAYVERTQVHGYKVRVRDVFEVCIPEERKAYEQNKHGVSHRELLFHGTHNRNVRHILRQGLICPRTASNGRMFGNGIYLANRSSKSINYCAVGRAGFPNMMFVVEAALGNSYVATSAKGFNKPPRGYDSVCGRAGHTKAWAAFTLQNDEFVVYRPEQQTIRYLVTFER
jgi:predicted DNA-binding WGR domain protein